MIAALPGGTCHPTVLTWGPSPSAPVLGYNVYRSTKARGPFKKLNTSTIVDTTFTDGTSQPGQTYFYAAVILP